MRPSLAIIGTGIAGLGAAYRLKDQFSITLFEKNAKLGGHTNTIEVEENGDLLPVDTGFIVHNNVTYPHLTSLFRELNIATANSDMSFSVWNPNEKLQWAGHTLNGLFADRRNLMRPKFIKLLFDANRFNKTSVSHLEDGRAKMPLGEYLVLNNYDSFFCSNYIIPMASAVWSTPPMGILQFPASTLIRFFKNHGFLGYQGQLQWKYVVGGSHQYVKSIEKALRGHRILTSQPIERVTSKGRFVMVRTKSEEISFDYVLIAAHADEALQMLGNPTDSQRRLLSAFSYERNQAILHTDHSVMPPNRRAWASWNYKVDSSLIQTTSLVYYMNRLQNLVTKKHYFVSLNEKSNLDERRILKQINYTHPLFDSATYEAQQSLPTLNEGGPIFFSGSYFRYGFHEDALLSGLKAAERLIDVAIVSV